MDQLTTTIIGGLVVSIIAAWLGVGGTTKVVVHGARVRKTGKWIIIISVLMIFGGLALVNRSNPHKMNDLFNPPAIYGLTLAGYGFIFFIIGRVVEWFQRP